MPFHSSHSHSAGGENGVCVLEWGVGGGGGRHVMSSDTGFLGEGSVNAALVIKINQKKNSFSFASMELEHNTIDQFPKTFFILESFVGLFFSLQPWQSKLKIILSPILMNGDRNAPPPPPPLPFFCPEA